MYKVNSCYITELTGILVTSASIAEDEKQISETAAKLATCREALRISHGEACYKKIQFIYKHPILS